LVPIGWYRLVPISMMILKDRDAPPYPIQIFLALAM